MAAAGCLFAVEFEVDPSADDPALRLEPAVVETTSSRQAPEPGTDDRRFFRDTLRRGEVNGHERPRAGRRVPRTPDRRAVPQDPPVDDRRRPRRRGGPEAPRLPAHVREP